MCSAGVQISKRSLFPTLAVFGVLAGAVLGCGAGATRTVTQQGRTVTVGGRGAEVSQTAPLPRTVLSYGALPHLAELVPRDATVLNSWTLPAAGGVPEQLVVTWTRQTHPDDYAERALVIWQRPHNRSAPWRRVYRLDRYRYAEKVDVNDITAQVADISGDGHLDVLAYQYTDGSGGCGIYDLLLTGVGHVRDIYHAERCFDDTVIGLRGHALVIDRGLSKAPHSRPVHPTFKTWRETVKGWNGTELQTTSRNTIQPSRIVNGPYGRGGH